jgi:ATP-binding cassette subfamily G (WHITE) protein 2
MKTLIDLAKGGRTVICTIHQPRSNIFSLFDQLLLLVDGYAAYTGPAKSAVDYFGSIGYKCEQFVNPADYFGNHGYNPILFS